MTTRPLEALAERHPALVNIALAATGLALFGALYWLIAHLEPVARAGGLP